VSISLPRLAVRRLRHQRGVAAALCAGLAAALGLTATVLTVQAMAAEAGLSQALAGTAGGLVTIQSRTPQTLAAFDAFQADTDRRVGASLGAHVQPVVRYVALAAPMFWTLNGQRLSTVPTRDNPNPPRPALAYSSDLASHVRVVAGQLPPESAPSTGDHPVAVSAAGPLGMSVGDRVCLGFVGGFGDPQRRGVFPTCLRVAATFRPLVPGDLYWQGRAIDQELLASSADVYQGLDEFNRGSGIRSTTATAGRLFRVLTGTLDTGNASDVAQRLQDLHGYYAIRVDSYFATDVASAIAGLQQQQQVGAYTVQLVAAALLLVALFAVSFVARHFLESQARELAALRARGWRRRRVLTFLVVQLLLLVLGALPLGAGAAALAWLALGHYAFTSPPKVAPADVEGVAVPLAAATAVAVLLLTGMAALAVRQDVLDQRRGASRPAGPAWWRWRGADLALAAVAVPLLAESRLRGSDQVRAAGGSDDPLALLFPGLAIALLAVAGLRLLPLVSRVALRWSGAVAGNLARWQLARRPGQHAALALLVTFAVAVGIFSSVYATTDRRNALDRAAYAAGADVRAGYTFPEPQLDVLSASLPGTTTSIALRVQTLPGSITDISSTTLAIDPATFPAVAWSRPGLTGPPVADLVRQLAARDPDGLDLPGRPRALSVWASYDGAQGELAADLTDAAGHTAALDLGPAQAGQGWRQLTAAIRFPDEAAPAYPVRLTRLVVRGPAHGSLALSDLAADGRVVEPFTGSDGWWSLETDFANTGPMAVAPSATLTRDGRDVDTVNVDLPNGSVTIQPAVSNRPVPAVISSDLLQSLSIGLEQPFPLHFDTGPVTVTAIEAVDSFPTLYPDDRFIVLPIDAVIARTEFANPAQVVPNELWVKTARAPRPLERRLLNAGYSAGVEIRADLEAAALSDPLRVALDGTLVVGFLATLAVAVLAFGIHFLSAARARLDEYAILRANGLSPGQVRRSLLLEQLVLLAHGLVVGGILGIAVSYAVLPAVQLGSQPGDLVPPTIVTPDPVTVAAAALAVLAGGLLGGWLARRSAGRLDVREQLRQLG
jgi:predicted lysophospholipase L1 biosynthesis ABC-type transport system permease subunit